MNESLRQESERLARSWMQHEADWLRDYLIAGVEDPRINLQSIITRHFLVRAIGDNDFGSLMEQECRFGAVMNWLVSLAEKAADPEELEAVLFGLRKGVDNVEGIEIPAWVLRIFRELPARVGSLEVPNYMEDFLQEAKIPQGRFPTPAECLNTLCRAWKEVLSGVALRESRISVLEPACGSANDFRFVDACGISPFIDYTGFDLCPKNIENARLLFPSIRFQTGNIFEISASDEAFELSVVHDLFEHLSLEGLEVAVKELCRVTAKSLCVGFFQMDEIPAHVVRPLEDYHWNLLSMARTKELFASCGFACQVLHIGTFLRETVGCDRTHNPNAYTFLARRSQNWPNQAGLGR